MTQDGSLEPPNSHPCLEVIRSGTASSTASYSGDLIYGNDAPNTATGASSTGNLLRL